ncbi:MAG: hypothetical protein KF688_13350 [Pirellulales bacterium]|nr:hypothetical protein [Pirellulales bacterium]
MVEDHLRNEGLDRVDAYRYNSASLRVRVIDAKFESMPRDDRDSIVEPFLDKLPPQIQADIVTLVLLAPSELEQPCEHLGESILNVEFEHPSPSML